MLTRAIVQVVNPTEKGFAGEAHTESTGDVLFSNFGYRKPVGTPAVPGEIRSLYPPMPEPGEEIILVSGESNHAKKWTIPPLA